MTDTAIASPLPTDNPQRELTIAKPDLDIRLRHYSVAGDTYTILVTGEESAGRFALIDMHVPPGGGPPPHRHDFEEMYSVLEGEVEFTFRGVTTVAQVGDTLNIPANAPHFFRNASDASARMLCTCSPPGQEEFFRLIGDPVGSRTAPPPQLTKAQQAERKERARALAPRFRTELLALMEA